MTSPCCADADLQLDRLNKEVFPAKMFCQADNLLVYTLFAGKGKKRHYDKVMLLRAQDTAQGSENSAVEYSLPMPPEEGCKGAAICKHLMDLNMLKAIWEDISHTVLRLQKEIPSFGLGETQWSMCLQQCIILSYLSRTCL